MAQRALGGVVGGGDGRVEHELEEGGQVGGVLAQHPLRRCRSLPTGRQVGQGWPRSRRSAAAPRVGAARAPGPLVEVVHPRRPGGERRVGRVPAGQVVRVAQQVRPAALLPPR